MNFKAERDGTYEVTNLKASDLLSLIKMVRLNEEWRKEEAELAAKQAAEAEKELHTPN